MYKNLFIAMAVIAAVALTGVALFGLLVME